MPTYIYPGVVVFLAAGQSVDVTDRSARLLGVPTTFLIATQINSAAGNVGIAYIAGNRWILKSAVIVTSATVANRTMSVNTIASVSSKTVVASSTGDLLDRELPVQGTGATTDTAVTNGQAGDTWTSLAVRVL